MAAMAVVAFVMVVAWAGESVVGRADVKKDWSVERMGRVDEGWRVGMVAARAA